ncbi:MAG TPA: anti-sigma factor [Bradyrhizobium sp.]|jgi:anti-sigma factor RsiW|nr:anti-sigma factor [Bradyrhizobium sp.]
MTAPLKDDDELLMNAYCDGELDPASAVEFERRLAADQALNARYQRLLSLRTAVRSLPRYELPAGLQDRIKSALDANGPGRPQPGEARSPGQVVRLRQRSWSFRALAAAAVLGAVISSAAMLTLQRYEQRDDVAREIVAGHIRGLLAPQPFDVASSDRHTVKPWFTSRLPESPQVPDLAAQGFMLVGGRVDVIGRDPVATIVYKHALHTISLTTLPAGRSVPDEVISGYNVRSWSDAEFTYVAVSDLPSPDLAIFERAFAASSAAPEVK